MNTFVRYVMCYNHSIISAILLLISSVLANVLYAIDNPKPLEITNYCTLSKISQTGGIYILKEKVNLKGRELVFPEGSILRYEGGCFVNGHLRLVNALLQGNVVFTTRITGSVANDTIKTEWYQYSDHVLYDIFEMAKNKVVLFEPNGHYFVDYCFYIPSCKIIGNDASIVLGKIKEHSSVSKCIKIRNRHYDGGGIDSFTILNLNFETEEDETFLFSMQNVRDVLIEHCSFVCKGKGTLCMHSLDIRGNAKQIVINDCDIENMSGARTGGGLWLRSFGEINDVTITHCRFCNNTTDEVLALNAVDADIDDIRIDSNYFHYERNIYSPAPHLFWGITRKNGNNNNHIYFSSNTLSSDFLPSYIICTNNGKNITIENCKFTFEDFTMHDDKFTTTLFNGDMLFSNNTIKISNLLLESNPLAQINIFSTKVVVDRANVFNDCSKCHLGAPELYSSIIKFDNSQLFNGRLPSVMDGNHITLGFGTPEWAANPFSHSGKSVWKNNTINSAKKFFFNLSYKNLQMETSNNKLKNIQTSGIKIR